MHQAGVTEGTATGMKAVADQLRQSLAQSVDTARVQSESSEDEAAATNLKASEAWANGFQPWIDAVLKDAEKRMETSNAQVKQIGPAPRNLRNRLVNAILAARKELSKG